METKKNFIKENLITLIVGLIILILIGVIATYTYSFFSVTTSNSNIIAGTAESLSISVSVSKLAPTGNGKLVPQLDDFIISAITGRNGSCIDDNNNVVCHIYKITATNNSSTVTSLNGTVTIDKKNNPNLKWARYTPGTNPVLVGGVKEVVDTSLTVSDQFTAGQTKEYYIVVWISETGMGQIDTGNYAGVVNFETYESLLPYEYDYYYGTLLNAINDINSNTLGTNVVSNKNSALVGIYIKDSVPNVVLLNDVTETAIVPVKSDMVLNLNGNTFTSGNSSVGLNISNGNVFIDGRVSGSKIMFDESANGGRLIQVSNSSGTGNSQLTIDGGTYEMTSANSANGLCPIYIHGTVNNETVLSNCTIKSNITSSAKNYGVYLGAKGIINNCFIDTLSTGDGVTVGVNNNAIGSEISYSTIKAESPYLPYTSNNSYNTHGVFNNPNYSISLNECYVTGMHSAVQNGGTIYVDGGIYQGYGHGGFYFRGENTVSYLQNAIIRYWDYDGNFDVDMMDGSNEAGMYIGASSNINVYVDNCDIYGDRQPIVLKGSSNEQNNILYISNSNITKGTEYGIRIDNSTHKVYMGTGNNFTISDVLYAPEGASNSVINTNETYARPD